MTDRKPQSDNALIDELEEQGGALAQGGRSGGDVARDVGTRAELNGAGGESARARPTAQDNTEAVNESKGDKAIERLDPANKR